jgi:hypothetical protein
MKKVLFFTACILFTLAGGAQAYYDLSLGGNFSYPIYSIVNTGSGPQAESYGGGSVDTSSLNGATLPWVYCVDFIKVVYVPGDYASTTTNNAGFIYGQQLPYAAQVAWLLTNENPTSGQGDQQKALQAAIWTVINDGLVNPLENQSKNYVYQLDPTQSSSTVVADYEKYLDDVITYGKSGGNIANFIWMTPGTSDSNGQVVDYQGLVTARNSLTGEGFETPIPAAGWLLGAGLLGITGLRRKYSGWAPR